MLRQWWSVLAHGAVLAAAATTPMQAQRGVGLDLGGALLAGGDEIAYLRSMQMLDSSAKGSVSIQPLGRTAERAWRAFGARSAGPWASRFTSPKRERSVTLPLLGETHYALLRGDAQLWYHSDFPAGEAPGVVWAGRGLTTAVQGGVRAEGRWWRAQLAPVGFVAENRGFPLIANGQTGRLGYADARFPRFIDLPQRFGDQQYRRVDWGDSYVAVEGRGVSAAFSTERQTWGPSLRSPLALSAESGGFAHFRLGTSGPTNVWIGRAQLRFVAGRLEQSSYSPVSAGETSRFLSAAIATFTPRGADGLEFGVIRMLNGPWHGLSRRLLLGPFEGVVNDSGETGINAEPDNGFASVFVRLSPPGTGVEVYGELARDDFAGNYRWLALEPEDLATYTIGVARSRRSPAAMSTLRAELVNSEVSHTERAARTLRRPFPPYIHQRTFQGLTNRGQLLGSAMAYGGAGAVVTYSRTSGDSRLDLSLSRSLRLDWVPPLGNTGGTPHGVVEYGLRTAMLFFSGRSEISVAAQPRYVLNHNLEREADKLSFELFLSVKGW